MASSSAPLYVASGCLAAVAVRAILEQPEGRMPPPLPLSLHGIVLGLNLLSPALLRGARGWLGGGACALAWAASLYAHRRRGARPALRACWAAVAAAQAAAAGPAALLARDLLGVVPALRFCVDAAAGEVAHERRSLRARRHSRAPPSVLCAAVCTRRAWSWQRP